LATLADGLRQWQLAGVALEDFLFQEGQGGMGVLQLLDDTRGAVSADVVQEQADFRRAIGEGCFLLWKRRKRCNGKSGQFP
jgi:hypothetical protein